MHDHPALVFTAFIVLFFGLFSKLPDRFPITGPMFFVAVGFLVGPAGFSVFDLEVEDNTVKVLAELTLVVILFVDASMINRQHFFSSSPKIAARLLSIGLPLCFGMGLLIGYLLFPEVDLWLIALVALILSPTDAALGQAVIKSETVPEDTRRAVSVESGLNDGIALPPFLVCVAAIGSGGAVIEGSAHWIFYTIEQLTVGPLVGAAVGLAGGRLVEFTAKKEWMDESFQRLSCLALAILSYACAEFLHGNGFIAAFFGGLFLGAKNQVVRARIQEFGEAEGQLLTLFVFLLFGMAAIPLALPYIESKIWLYAILSLTLIRMLPTVIALYGSGLDLKTKVFIGWFGPRGIASVLYLLIFVGELGYEGYEPVVATIVVTVTLSIILHGISAVPLANRLFK